MNAACGQQPILAMEDVSMCCGERFGEACTNVASWWREWKRDREGLAREPTWNYGIKRERAFSIVAGQVACACPCSASQQQQAAGWDQVHCSNQTQEGWLVVRGLVLDSGLGASSAASATHDTLQQGRQERGAGWPALMRASVQAGATQHTRLLRLTPNRHPASCPKLRLPTDSNATLNAKLMRG